ncbi:TetR/AcrR family transcriptional regulator [Nocardia sp. NPDC052566]|uniref:TetR/AcrR family transcriptional regulator n=1 Tax=Nocardia sp. NPDC052566 TaxID=3364330 RepID=UPI0037CCBC3E
MPRPVRNRQALLDAAISCIQTQGYARTTARDLVAMSKTNLGAIGYHFGSKEALMNEALAECFRQLSREVGSAVSTSGDNWRDMLAATYRTVQDNRAVSVAYLEAWAQAERAPELRDQLATHYREFRTTIAALVEAATSGRGTGGAGTDSAALAAVLTAVADGLTIQWLLDPDALPGPDRLARTLAPLVGLDADTTDTEH